MPLVTCIVPVYNGERYLGAAIESILAQDHRSIEVIVVDDGSTDRSADIAASYGSPVRVVQQENAGPPTARNHGIRESEGAYVTFLDADDLYRPSKVSTQLRLLLDAPEVDLCVCTAQNFWEPGLQEEETRYREAGRVLITHHFATLFVARAVFDQVGPISEEGRSADYIEWFHRAGDLGLATRVLPDVLIDRRMHAASMSRSQETIDDYFALARARIERHRT